jgi:hypothetical protein
MKMAFPSLHINNPILKRELEAAFAMLLTMKGNMYFVHHSGSAYSAGTDIEHPVATINQAVDLCTANQGDVIIVLPGHAETIIAASAIDIDIAGIKIYGIGEGEDRPKITISTAADASIEFAANSTVFKNIILICTKDGLTGPMLLKGVGLDIDVETRDSTNLLEAATWFLSEATCNHLKLKAKHIGFTDGSGTTSYIKLVGANYPRIKVDFFGLANTSVVEFSGTKAINAIISGNIYNEGDTTYAKFVVDTIGSSTWVFSGQCGENGTMVQGSQDVAIAGTDTSAIAAALATIDAFHDVPSADTADNVVMSDVIGNKTDTSSGDSLYALLLQIIALSGTPAADLAADIAAIKAVVDDIETATITEVASLITFHDVPSQNSSDNANLRDAVGNKTDTTAGTSLIALCKQIVEDTGTTIPATISTIDSFHDVPAKDSTDNAVVSDVLGNKTDIANETADVASVIGLLRQALANVAVIDGLQDVPTQNLATNATINQAIGNKTDTTAGTSIISLVKQIIEDTGVIGTIVNAGGTATLGALLGDFANVSLVTKLANLQTEADKIETPSAACNRQAGKTQIFTKNITAAANAGVTTVGTITTQPCLIKRIVLRANGVTTANLTSAAIEGGASQVVEFISAATAVTASINADDEQVAFSGAAVLDATKTITIDLQGTGAAAVDLDVIVEYCATVAGGYIA